MGEQQTLDVDREPVAYAYEVRKVKKTDHDYAVTITDWSTYIERKKPSEDDWKETETQKHEIRNIQPLVYGDDCDADDVVGYYFRYQSRFGDGVKEAIKPADPRGSDSLVEVKPLVPLG